MTRVRVLIDGQPLRYAFVSHTPNFENPIVAITNDEGEVTIAGVNPRDRIDVVVHAQNLAVRMLNGEKFGVSESGLRFRNRADGATLRITKADKKHFESFKIMESCYDVYETVFRPIPPFTSRYRQAFPFGGSSNAPEDLKRRPKIDCRFPEKVAPGKLPWVQPRSFMTGLPLMHLKSQATDARLFGSPTKKASFIPHEFAHAIHFAALSHAARTELSVRYGSWIVKELLKGRSGTHRTNKSTDPLVAYVEALGIFSQRFYFFAKEVRPDLSAAPLRTAFVKDELSGSPSLANVFPAYVRVASRQTNGKIEPSLTGDKTEGAVYGAIFLDFASRTSLAIAVNLYLRSDLFGFGGYQKYAGMQRNGTYKKALRAVKTTWKM